MAAESWDAFYHSDLQGLYALLVAPALFLVYRIVGREPGETASPSDRFVRVYALVFCLETLLDPIATGPLTRVAELGESASTAVMLLFVLLGDFRVFLPVLFLTRPGAGFSSALGWSALLTTIVPVSAYAIYFMLGLLVEDLHGQVLWIVYEIEFVVMALVLRGRVIPQRLAGANPQVGAALRRATAFAAGYYGLWVASDLLIVGAGLDVGWLLRAVPNQLYYAFWIPFFYASWFARR